MFSAWLAIANAVQLSVCSGVLRVLGLAQAGPSGVALEGFFNRSFLGSDWALRELSELGGVGNAVQGQGIGSARGFSHVVLWVINK